VASRNDLAFQRDFFAALSKELALPRAIAADLPPGVVATARTDGETRLSSCRTTARKAIP
jgi:beta-galactosidase